MNRLTVYDYIGGVKIGDLKAGVKEIKAFDRLAAYEDTGLEPEDIKEFLDEIESRFILWVKKKYEMSTERFLDIMQAEKDGRLAILPCKNDIVYTIEEDFFNCKQCKQGNLAFYQSQIDKVSCDFKNRKHCPFYIKARKVDGFEVNFDEKGALVLSPMEFGAEGLDTFCGIDDKCYYICEEAEAALKRLEADDETDLC